MKTKRAADGGFTLVEMSIVLIIVGIMLAAFAGPYALYKMKKSIDDTDIAINDVVTKIGEFRSANGRYPCPASLTATRDDAPYGRETDCTDTSTVAVGGALPADIASAYFVQENTRTIDGVSVTQRIRVGAVPFRHLNLPEDSAYDGYGGRLLYAVTEDLAQPGNFKPTYGGIQIVDSAGVSVVEPAGSAHFIVLSHGANQEGAFTRAGARIPCPATGTESQNCNLENAGIFTITQKVGRTGTTHYDDVAAFYTATDIPAWQPSQAAGHENDINQIPQGGGVTLLSPSSANPSAPVGDGVLSVQNTMKVDGNALTERGVHVQQLCQADGTNCFPSSMIAGEEPSMNCPPNEVATRIENNRVVCTPRANLSVQCPANRYLVGFNSSGQPICEAPPVIACPALNVTVCGQTFTLPPAYSGTTQWINAGLSFRRQYRCSGTRWSAVSGTDSGLCTCTPGTETNTIACDAGFTGTRRVERYYTCPAGTFSGWVDVVGGNNCVCQPTTQSYTETCPAGHTGLRTYSRTHVCPANGTPYWTNYSLLSDTCTCVPRTETRQIACSGGLDGVINQSRNWTCPAATFTAWAETSRTCSCTPTTDNRTDPCPSGYEGTGIRMTRTRTCTGTTSSWSAWTESSRSCTQIPPVVCTLQPVSAATGGSTPYADGPSVGRRCDSCGTTSNCSRNNGNGTYTNYPSCVCK